MSEETAFPVSHSDAPEDAPFKPMPILAPLGEAPERGLGRRVSTARAHYKLNAAALSRLTKSLDTHEGRGISPPSIARYESGESMPGARELRLLAQALGVPTDWLIYGTINAAGKSEAEQAVISALRQLIAEHLPDAGFSAQIDATVNWHAEIARLKMLQDARKPN